MMTAEQRYPHLAPAAAQMADADNASRIEYIRRDRFIYHKRAEEILIELEVLCRMEDAIRPQGRLLVGRSLMGKSSIFDEFLRNHRASDNPDGEAAVVPVLVVQYPEVAQEGIYPEILNKLGAKMPANSKLQDLRRSAIDLLHRVGLRILLIDELHNVLEGSANAQRKGLNSIKYLMNELRRPVVCAGTVEVLNAIKSDPQMYSRLKRLPLARFADDMDFLELLVGFEMALPLRKSSGLDDVELSSLIFQVTRGIVGEASDLLNSAAIYAIEEGFECITVEVLKAVTGQWPSDEDIAKML
jgi:hypothetical protein